jgi:type II secretory pathway pseudopilin PulG
MDPYCERRQVKRETRNPGRIRPGAGFTIIEAVVGIALLSLIMAGALAYLAGAWRSVQVSQNRIFATQKAVSILNEVRSFVETQSSQAYGKLDDLDNGITTTPYLTIASVPSADHAASGNELLPNGQWKYARHITVRPLPNVSVRDIRLVLVQVYEHNDQGKEVLLADVGTVVHTVSDDFPTTQVYDVYALAVENVPGWWVYMSNIRPFVEDTITDLENRNPGLKFRTHWITKLGYGRDSEYTPVFNEDPVDSRQPVDYVYFYPGKMPAQQTNIISSNYYYVPNITSARFLLKNVLASPPTLQNDYDGSTNWLTHNKWPYALADSYNHAMRYQDEWNYFQARYNDAVDKPDGTKDRKETSDCLTWRLLLDDMVANPGRYTNAILINLHGELLPMPPVRNYSDAAKDPATYPHWRVVTHPENIWYFRSGVSINNSESPKLRVYAYLTKPDDATLPATMGAVPISIAIKDADLTGNVNGATNPTLTIQQIPGGINTTTGALDTTVAYTALANAPSAPGGGTPYGMYYQVTYEQPSASTKYTLIKLYNTPLKCPKVGSGTTATGLPTASRLYGYCYIPCAAGSANNFSTNLASQGEFVSGSIPLEKNTARWVITIPKNNLGSATLPNTDQVLTVSTYVGDISQTVAGVPMTCGVMYPPDQRFKPRNISRTYSYWSNNSSYVPFTERYQFLGDPRHCPYGDLKNGGVTYSRDGTNTTKTFPNGYNWYFDNFKTSSVTDALTSWPGFDGSRIGFGTSGSSTGASDDGWKGDMCEQDVPRFYLLLRTALTQSDALFTTLTGFSFFYMGLGGEIGYDSANGYSSGVPISSKPYDGTNNPGWEQWMTNYDLGSPNWGYGVKYIKEDVASNYWWGKNWIGELYPDTDNNGVNLYTTQWSVNGNLSTGTGAGHFRRTLRSNINVNLPRGTALLASRRRTAETGCTSFFDVEPVTGNYFQHLYADGTTGNLTTAGQDMAQTYFFPLPTSAKISRPFSVQTTTSYGTGDEWSYGSQTSPNNDDPRFKAEVVAQFYDHSTGNQGSSLVAHQLYDLSKASFVIVNGIDKTTETGSAFIAKYSLLSLIHGYLTAGLYNKVGQPNGGGRVHELPRTTIKEPTSITQIDNPTAVNVRWGIQWRRWDGQPYTSDSRYSTGYAGEPDEPNLRYVVCYSPDNGITWKFMKEEGVSRLTVDDQVDLSSGYLPIAPNPAADAVRSDNVVGGDETLAWDVSDTARFPQGSYLVRVETFRSPVGSLPLPMHYSYHIEKIYVYR